LQCLFLKINMFNVTNLPIAMKKITYQPIGIIHSPFTSTVRTPIQPSSAEGYQGTVEVFPEYAEGLKDIEGFSHLLLVYHFHLSQDFKLLVKPYLDDKVHGVFATRAPKRPNGIGISTVKLLRVEGHTLYIENVDILDGTPLLDIKPYVPQFHNAQHVKVGWLTGKENRIKTQKADDRFD